MSIEPKDVLDMIPGALATAKSLVELVSPRAGMAIGFGGEVAAFIIQAEKDGMSPELVVEKVDELTVDLLKRLKFGT